MFLLNPPRIAICLVSIKDCDLRNCVLPSMNILLQCDRIDHGGNGIGFVGTVQPKPSPFFLFYAAVQSSGEHMRRFGFWCRLCNPRLPLSPINIRLRQIEQPYSIGVEHVLPTEGADALLEILATRKGAVRCSSRCSIPPHPNLSFACKFALQVGFFPVLIASRGIAPGNSTD